MLYLDEVEQLNSIWKSLTATLSNRMWLSNDRGSRATRPTGHTVEGHTSAPIRLVALIERAGDL